MAYIPPTSNPIILSFASASYTPPVTNPIVLEFDAAGGSTLKTVVGILVANIASINGLSIGSVKTYLGLTP